MSGEVTGSVNSSRNKIGIAGLGGANWIGGAELSKNLVLAANEVISERKWQDLEVTLLGGNLAELKARLNVDESFASQLSSMPWPPEFSYKEPPPWRSIPKISRWLFGKWPDVDKQRRLHEAEALIHGGFKFVYGLAEAPRTEEVISGGWIPDLQHCEFPELFSSEECESRDRWIEDSCRDHEFIVFSSQHALTGFRSHFSHLRDVTKTFVLPFRVRIDKQIFLKENRPVASRYGLPPEFFLVCNQLWKHKNHLVILEALSSLKKSGRLPVVAMTGRLHDYRNPDYVDDFLRAVHERGLHDSVRLLGLIPKEDQLSLLSEAQAVIQPSLFEGWNTCVEECHALGSTLFLSDIPVHREQEPPGARYFDPLNPDSLAELMRSSDLLRMSSPLAALNDYEKLFRDFGEQFLKLTGASVAFEGNAMSSGDTTVHS